MSCHHAARHPDVLKLAYTDSTSHHNPGCHTSARPPSSCSALPTPLAGGYGKGAGTRPAVPMQLPPEVDETVRNHYPKRPTLTDAGVATMKVRLLACANLVCSKASGAHLFHCELNFRLERSTCDHIKSMDGRPAREPGGLCSTPLHHKLARCVACGAGTCVRCQCRGHALWAAGAGAAAGRQLGRLIRKALPSLHPQPHGQGQRVCRDVPAAQQ